MAGKAKAAAAAASAQQDVTLALSQALPSLLRKFQTDPTKVAPHLLFFLKPTLQTQAPVLYRISLGPKALKFLGRGKFFTRHSTPTDVTAVQPQIQTIKHFDGP